MTQRIEVTAWKIPFQIKKALFVMRTTNNLDGSMPLVERLSPSWIKYDECEVQSEGLLGIDETASQTLMDTLWDCGVRPTAGSGSAGALKAIEYHLEDMRKLVFK